MRTFMYAKVPVKMDYQGDCNLVIAVRIQDHQSLLFQFADICDPRCGRPYRIDLSGSIF